MKNVLLCLLFLTLIVACKKDSNNKIIGTYTTGATIQVDPPMMFTRNGMIHDLQLIKDFLQRDTSFLGTRDTGFIFNQNTEVNKVNYSLDFRSNDTVYITDNITGIPTTRKYLQQRSGSEIVLSPVDSSWIILNGTQPHDRFWFLSYKLEKNNTGQFSLYNVPAGSWAKAKYNTTLLNTNGNLVMPLTKSHFHLAGPSSSSYSIYWSNNSWLYLNMNIQNELQAGDTLVVQTKTINLLKQ